MNSYVIVSVNYLTNVVAKRYRPEGLVLDHYENSSVQASFVMIYFIFTLPERLNAF
jgi:hypothetical protein